MKLSFSTLGCYNFKLEDMIKLANKYHIDALEVRGINDELDNEKILEFDNLNYQNTISLIKNNGLEFNVLGTSCKFHDEITYHKYLPKAFKEIDIASKLGFKAIRIFGNNIINNDSYDYLINAINILCAYDPNINIYLETHGDFNNHKTLLPIVNNIKYDNFGLIWDIYHTYRYYQNDFEPFYNYFKPYIRHVHIKDSLNDHPVLFGKGEIDVQKVINKLTDDQYQGYLSIEWEKKWYDDLEDLEEVLISFNDYKKRVTSK